MIKTKFVVRMLAGAALLLTPMLPTQAQEAAATTATPAPAAAAQPATVDANPALWVVRDEDTTIYLFGTIHILRPNIVWFDDAVRTAFDASDELRVETLPPSTQDEQQAFARTVLGLARDNEHPLTTRLSAEQRASLERLLDGIGVPLQAMNNFDPWFVSLQLTLLQAQRAGMGSESGVDNVLLSTARTVGKPVSTFETTDEQLGFIDSAPIAEQVTGLMAAVDDMNGATELLNRLVDSWVAGTPDTTAQIMNEGLQDTPETRRILLTDRNRRWADNLRARMAQPGTLFVAVGAGHLAGDNSVQQMLEQAGFTVTRVE